MFSQLFGGKHFWGDTLKNRPITFFEHLGEVLKLWSVASLPNVNLKGLRLCRRPPKIMIFWSKIFGFWVSTHFRYFKVKNEVFGVRDHHQWIRIEIWSHIQVSMPQIVFSEAISEQITCF